MKWTILHSGKFFPGLYILMVLLFASEAYPQQTFVKKIIGAGSPIATIQSSDGGYVSLSQLAANTFLVRKVNSSGARVWERRLHFDIFTSLKGIAQTTDGGYVLVGLNVFDNGSAIYTSGLAIKLGPGGGIQWKKAFRQQNCSGHCPQDFAAFNSVSSTLDDGFVLTGKECSIGSFPIFCAEYSTILVRFSSLGTVVWKQSFSDLNPVPGNNTLLGFVNLDVVSASDGGFFVAAQKKAGGATVIRVDGPGNILWRKLLEIDDFLLSSVAATSDRGAILAGRCDGPLCNQELFLVRLKSNGQIEWKRRFAFDVPIQSISDVTQTYDGGYLLTGTAGNDIFVFQIDSSQKVVFETTFGGNGQDKGKSIFSSINGGLVLFGSNGKDMLLLKLNSDGLVSGCSLSGSLRSLTRPFGNVKISAPQINSTNLSLFEFSLQVNSANSQKPVSTVCP